MARFYKSGRTRTIRQRVTVAVEGTYRGIGSDAGASTTMGAGSSYSVTPASGFTPWIAYSTGFGVVPALGTIGGLGTTQRVLGVQVRSKTGNGFVPLLLLPVSVLAIQRSISASVVINRVMVLIEVFAHDNNGRRLDRFGAAGTCTETYTVNETTTFTSRDGTDMVEGQSPPALGTIGGGIFPVGFGIVDTALTATARAVGPFGGVSISAGATLTWSAEYLDNAGDPLVVPAPDAPTHSTSVGSSSWGSLVANAPAVPATGTEIRRTVSVSFQWMPRHAFDVSMRPLEIPTLTPLVWPHRLEVDYTTGPPASTLYTTSGETISLLAGGVRWIVAHQGSIITGAGTTAESGVALTYDSLQRIPSRITVTTGARAHFACRVLAPYNAISLSQASAVTLPGGAGTTIAAGATTTLGFSGQRIGYRYVRVRAKSPLGTGTLTIKSYLNGDTTNHTASKTLTTTVANTTETVEIDLLEVPGCTNDPKLYLEQLTFAATGAGFTIETLELFRRDESVMQSLSPLRALPPIETGIEVPWLRCFTDGVESLTMNAGGGSLPTVNSLTVRQLVAEINGTSRHSYPGTWSPPNAYTMIDGGAATAPSPLLGWVATDSAAPRVGKDYGVDAIGEPGDFGDSDIYVSALHGDGIIGSALCLARAAGELQAQRFSASIEPGVLPGRCGFDGEAAGDMAEGGMSFSCPIIFTALLRGLATGMIIPGGSLAVNEVSVTTGAGTTTYPTPIPRGRLVARASGYALGDTGLRGIVGNGALTSANADVFTNEVDNPGGTPATSASIEPYHRQLTYDRFWPGVPSEPPTAIEHDPARAWVHVVYTDRVATYWRESGSALPSRTGLDEAFEGEDLSIGTIHALVREASGRLLVLTQSASTWSLYTSGDGGLSVGGAVVVMTNAASALVGYDGVRNWMVVWWEDATTHQVKRRISRDGGDSWESAESCTWTPAGGSSENLLAELFDVKFVRELAGRFAMVIKENGASTGATIMSGDGGLTWSQVL